MKRFILMLLLVGWCTAFLAAQEKAPTIVQLTEALDLTEQQVEALTEIRADYKASVTKVRTDKRNSRAHHLADMGRARANRDRAIFELLTDAQRDTYLELEEVRKAEIRRRHRPSKG